MDAAGASSDTTPAPPPNSITDGSGCRAGDACPYLHDVTKLPEQGQSTEHNPSRKSGAARPPGSETARPSSSQHQLNGPAPAGTLNSDSPASRHGADAAAPERIVGRPVPRKQLEDPREFQIGQIRRRFGPSEQADGDALALTFKMTPSDPDFPFDITALECKLSVPSAYPENGHPRLRILNKEMGRGFQINVEKGFDDLFSSNPNATLLGLMNRLDQQLERLLSMEKADTVKLVPNTRPVVSVAESLRQGSPAVQTESTSSTAPMPLEPQYTPEQKQAAQMKREADVRQLEARMGRFPLFQKHSDGISFIVPIEPRKRSDLPVPLQAIKQVNLIVPVLYNLHPCRIELEGVSKEAAINVEKAFELKATEIREATLLSLINNLTQNIHVMATTVSKETSTEDPDISQLTIEREQVKSDEDVSSIFKVTGEDDDRGHIKIIPRPPEWTTAGEDSDSSSGSYMSDSESESGGEEETSGEDKTISNAPTTVERGVMVSFPFLELHGIELLELVSLSITIKCERCKDTKDINNLKNNANGDASGMRSESCKKCANPFEVGYRMDLMHANSVRAGYLDLEGCTVVDMLPRYS
ncbi:MAG: hypothetical protein Q9165_002918 [Trypethelium subeluteriae]